MKTIRLTDAELRYLQLRIDGYLAIAKRRGWPLDEVATLEGLQKKLGKYEIEVRDSA